MTIALVEQDVELGQLHQAIEQHREEKAKESGHVEKLTKELKGEVLHDQSYCWSNFLA